MSLFIYDSEFYCEDCAGDCIARLRADFPKTMTKRDIKEFNEIVEMAWDDSGDPADEPLHCAAGSDCVNAFDCGGAIVGKWLENGLTSEGEKFTLLHIARRDRVEWKFWMETYKDSIKLPVVVASESQTRKPVKTGKRAKSESPKLKIFNG